MQGFRLEARDEYPHRLTPEPTFNESVYTNAFDPGLGMGGWMRIGNRANEGYAEVSVCLYLPDGRLACQFGRAPINGNGQFSAGGLSVNVVEPLKVIDMAYDGELMVLDDPEALRRPETLSNVAKRVPASVRWSHVGVSPIHGGEPTSPDQPTMYGRDFSLGHFNQHTRAAGEIRIGEEVWPFNGSGWRDHSWGPRQWQAIRSYRLFLANFDDGRGFMLLKIGAPDGGSRRVGVLMVGGAYEEIIDLDVLTGEWTPGKTPSRMLIGARTARRAVLIEGEALNVVPLRNRRRIGDDLVISNISEAFTRFRWDGAEGLGMSEYIDRIEGGELAGYPL